MARQKKIDQSVNARSSYADKIQALSNLQRPPREVPFLSKVDHILTFLSMFGIFFFGFGMVFVWVFFQPAKVIQDYQLNMTGKKTRGKVIRIEDTNMSVNNRQICRFIFEYETKEGLLRDKSYGSYFTFDEGDDVDIEYLPGDHNISRISGTQRSQAGIGSAFVLLFPAVGFLLFSFGVCQGLKRIKLLTDGMVTEAAVVNVRPTNVRKNRQMEYEITYEYATPSGKHVQSKYRTFNVVDTTDEEKELVFFSERYPEDVYPVDDIPGGLRVNQRGELMPPPAGEVLVKLFIFGLCTLPHMFIAVVKISGLPF